MSKIVIAGGTGNLGQLIIQALVSRNFEVIVLTRGKPEQGKSVRYIRWDGETLGDWVHSLENADVLINLSGKSVNVRFTATNKKELRDSRLLPTRVLGKAIESLRYPPRLWINASGISIYDGIISGPNVETSENYGSSFLAELTKEWENELWEATTIDTKRIALRISPVLSKDWGMFSELYPITKLGLGGSVGNGEQYISWIHAEDFVSMILWLLVQRNPDRIYHACSPSPVKNREFMRALREATGISFGLPLPAPLAKVGAWLKGVDPGLLLETVFVASSATVQQGFEFKYQSLREAFGQLVQRTGVK